MIKVFYWLARLGALAAGLLLLGAIVITMNAEDYARAILWAQGAAACLLSALSFYAIGRALDMMDDNLGLLRMISHQTRPIESIERRLKRLEEERGGG